VLESANLMTLLWRCVLDAW